MTTISAVREPDAHNEWFVDVIDELKRIRPSERSALVLSYFHGLSHPTIADRLGLSTIEVHRLVAHGLAQLGAALSERDIALAETA